MMCRSYLVLAALAAGGCGLGMGPSTAATRPILGQTMSNDDAKMWVPSADQSNVPQGLVRVEWGTDSFARIFNYVSITSGVKKGSVTPTIAGDKGEDREVIALDLALTGRIPLPIGGISLGLGRVWSIEDDAAVSGPGVRASIAPIGQLSIDFAHSWVSGTLETDTMSSDLSGTHTSLGGTVLVWGYNMFRFGVAVAKTWTSTDGYSSSGYSYQLVSTMY